MNAFLEENRLPGVEIGILSEATRGHGLGFSGTMSAALATALFVMAKKCSKSDLESDGFEKTAAFREIFALASEMTRKLRYENSLGSNIAAGLMKGNLLLLEQTVIDAFRIEESSLPPMVSDRDVSASEAKLSAPISGPTAYYQLRVKRQTGAATLSFQLDFNVTTVNVVIYLPWIGHEVGDDLNKAVKARLCGTFEGARHEGYDFDANVARITVDGKTFVVLCARKRLRQDFLWDPGSKLYFVQDLRFFLFSLMVEADGLCCESA